jgi:acetyltransferase-like isoleucine patch superfamily enzyme
MAYLSQQQLSQAGFRRVGRNVLVSDKAAIYNADQIEIGDHSRIDDFCVLSGRITIGRHVHVTVFCNIAGASEGVVIGDFCALSYRTCVFTRSEDYSGQALPGPLVPARYTLVTNKAVQIGDHCIVGAGCVIMPGASLAVGTSVGAMSLVLTTTQEWSIYTGVPARKLKDRQRGLLDLHAQYLASLEGESGNQGTPA